MTRLAFLPAPATLSTIKAFRLEFALTQLQLAELLGLQRVTIEKIEQGKNPIASPLLFALALEALRQRLNQNHHRGSV